MKAAIEAVGLTKEYGRGRKRVRAVDGMEEVSERSSARNSAWTPRAVLPRRSDPLQRH